MAGGYADDPLPVLSDLPDRSERGARRGPAAPRKPGGVTIRIHDSGEGIPAASLRRIFDDGYTTRAGAARGLGLGITQRICQAAGGRLRVNSAPGLGTTFTLWLPCEDPAPWK